MLASQRTLYRAQIIVLLCIWRAPNILWSRLITRPHGKQLHRSKYFDYATEKQIPFPLWLALSLPPRMPGVPLAPLLRLLTSQSFLPDESVLSFGKILPFILNTSSLCYTPALLSVLSKSVHNHDAPTNIFCTHTYTHPISSDRAISRIYKQALSNSALICLLIHVCVLCQHETLVSQFTLALPNYSVVKYLYFSLRSYMLAITHIGLKQWSGSYSLVIKPAKHTNNSSWSASVLWSCSKVNILLLFWTHLKQNLVPVHLRG